MPAEILSGQKMGGAGIDFGLSIAIDVNGNILTTGLFNGTANFGPSPGTYNLTSTGADDIFISCLDTSGNFLWAKQMGGTNSERSSYHRNASVNSIWAVGCNSMRQFITLIVSSKKEFAFLPWPRKRLLLCRFYIHQNVLE